MQKNRKEILRQNSIELKEVIKIIPMRKWWFISSAILVLIMELIYIFFNHKDYLLILNIGASLFFSILIGAILTLTVNFFLTIKHKKKSHQV